MSKLTDKLIKVTGYDITRQPYKYVSIDTSRRRMDNIERTGYNYYAQWKNKADFRMWLKENVAKRYQEDWVLYRLDES